MHVDEEKEEGDCMFKNPISRHSAVATEMGKHEGLQVEDSANDVYNLPDLNVTADMVEMVVDTMAIIPFQQHNTTQEAHELTLFGVAE